MFLRFENLKDVRLKFPDLIKLVQHYSLEEKIQNIVTGVYIMRNEM